MIQLVIDIQKRMMLDILNTVPPGIEGHLRFASFHELSRACKRKQARRRSQREPFFPASRMNFMNFHSEHLFHLADTYRSLSEMSCISFKKWSHYKARVSTFCELVYDRKLVKARLLHTFKRRVHPFCYN